MLVNSKMPLSSKSFPLLTKFYGCTIMILAVSLCCSCWVYSYYFMNPSGWDVYHLPALLEKIIFNCLGPALNLPCKSSLLLPSSNPSTIDVRCHENQAFVEDNNNGLQLKGTVDESTDKTKSEMISSQRSSSLVDGAVPVQLKAAAESSTDQPKTEKNLSRRGRSLTDGAVSVDDKGKKGELREEEKCSTVCCSNHTEEEAESNLVNEALSVDNRELKEEDPKEEEESSTTVKGDCDTGLAEGEDGSSSESSKKKKKKKKQKKKKGSKLVRKTIALQRIAESADQHISEPSNAQQDIGGADKGDNGHDGNDGDNNCYNIVDSADNNDNNLQEEEEHVTETSVSEPTVATAVPSDSLPSQNCHLLYLAQSSQQTNQRFENTERWKLAAIILDRLFIILLVVSIVVAFLACFLSSPRVRIGLI